LILRGDRGRRAAGRGLAADLASGALAFLALPIALAFPIALGLALAPLPALAASPPGALESGPSAPCAERAAHTEIVRDEWGIAHVYGRSDADAVFGALYAQAEDDFGRIEHNYLAALGRRAEAEGESALYADLRQRLFVDPAQLRALHARSPAWLRALMQGWADGLNCFLATNPQVEPRVLQHFEPWMTLAFTEGSIGGDVETVDLEALARFYGPPAGARRASAAGRVALEGARAIARAERAAPTSGGSNGFALAPSRTASGHALLWINPHTSFYFRAEMQIASESGLDVYGALTWGQFFVYQGFNARNGWMHTSYGGDAIDEYAEDVLRQGGQLRYRYGTGTRPLRSRRIALLVRTPTGLATRRFTVYRSHHGPIVRSQAGRWIAVRMLEDPVHALEQSFLRTRTADYVSFRRVQTMRTDTSNNTVYADADGTIAYFHGNFIPRRDPRFDYTHPVPGSDPATEWHGAHALEETITLLNPPNGWIENTNNWPFSAAGAASPKREDYPRYMWTRGENPRGLHAVEVLEPLHDATLEKLIAAGYDPHLNAFDELLPPLMAAYERLDAGDPRRARLSAAIESLRRWDRRSSVESMPTALAIYWGQALVDRKGAEARAAEEPVFDFLVGATSDAERIAALEEALARLTRDFGRWRIGWGEINRYQRLDDAIEPHFDDAAPSWPVGFAPSQWGSLASFDGSGPRTTKHLFGSVGNSFVAAVEFGPTVRAKAVLTGGESGHPGAAHFTDQAALYCEGRLRDVHFTREDVLAHAERRYHPGEP